MRVRHILVTISVVAIRLMAQAPPPSDARVSASAGVIDAGKTIEITIDLSKPPDCDTTLGIQFRLSNDNGGVPLLQAQSQVRAGETSVKVQLTVPVDQPGGTYAASLGYLNACPHHAFSTELHPNAITIKVNPIESSRPPAQTVIVKLSLTEQQYLDSKQDELSELNSRFENGLAANSSPVLLNAFLKGIVTDALTLLTNAEGQYDRDVLKQNGELPAFFGDFRSRYQGFIAELDNNAHTNHTATKVELAKRAPALVYVQQLKTREQDHLPQGEWPAIVDEIEHAIKDEIAAYVHARSTGRYKFTAVLLSKPPGARVKYKKFIDAGYLDYGAPTDVDRAEFDLARYEFLFSKPGCKDQYLRINPYQGTEPVPISVEFGRNCKK